MYAIVDGFEIHFDTFEDFESWYAEHGHRLPDEPTLFYEDEEGNEMARVFDGGEWEEYHTIDGLPVSEEDWEAHMNSGLELGDEIEDFEALLNGEYDDGLPF